MKLKLTIFLMLILALFITGSATPAGDYCSATAKPACKELELAMLLDCYGEGTNPYICDCRARRTYNACMEAFGCPGYSEQFMIETGCGPD